MKKILILLFLNLFLLPVNAFQYSEEYSTGVKQVVKKDMPASKVREIKNLTDYFKYLPAAVNKNWTPYKSNSNYEVEVIFQVNQDGTISNPEIVRSTNERANTSVLNAVTLGAPYLPLPKSFTRPYVKAQIILEYRK